MSERLFIKENFEDTSDLSGPGIAKSFAISPSPTQEGRTAVGQIIFYLMHFFNLSIVFTSV